MFHCHYQWYRPNERTRYANKYSVLHGVPSDSRTKKCERIDNNNELFFLGRNTFFCRNSALNRYQMWNGRNGSLPRLVTQFRVNHHYQFRFEAEDIGSKLYDDRGRWIISKHDYHVITFSIIHFDVPQADNNEREQKKLIENIENLSSYQWLEYHQTICTCVKVKRSLYFCLYAWRFLVITRRQRNAAQHSRNRK